jgi:hypothetical protein
MKVSEYHKKGLKNFVNQEEIEGYEVLGEAKEKVHRVKCFVKKEQNKIVDAKFTASKRCKKLLAIADLVCEKIKEKGDLNINFDEILEHFKEEKEQDKMEARLNIVKKAVLGG